MPHNFNPKSRLANPRLKTTGHFTDMDYRFSFIKKAAAALCILLPGLAFSQQSKPIASAGAGQKQTASAASKPAAAQADAPIYLVNSSFEDIPRASEAPTGWYNCGPGSESPPDVQPGFFQVNKQAQNGSTYLGLVVRDNETNESVSQRLAAPLEAGKCYTWSLQICRSELYSSQSRKTNDIVNYSTPAKVRVWGGTGYCNKAELLAETSPIKNDRWLQYDFRLQPKQVATYIVIEAYWVTPLMFYYNGNILIDNAGPILPIQCAEKPPKPKPAAEASATKPPAKTPAKTPAAPAPKPDDKPVFSGVPLKPGEIVKVEKIQFDADKADLKPESYPTLEQIHKFLQENERVAIEIGGHTNNLPPDNVCDELSESRAKAVADYLVGKGIPGERVKFKGYGKRYPISPNTTKEGRKKNQRVEIKILSVG